MSPKSLPTSLVLATALAACLAAAGCKSRVIKPERDVRVVTDADMTEFDIIDDAEQEQPSMITSEGTMLKMYYVRRQKANTLKELIEASFPPEHVKITTKPDFHTAKAGGLDLMIVNGPPENVDEIDSFISLIEAEVLQVEINVRVVEVTRTNTNQRGISINAQEVNPANPNTLFNQATGSYSAADFLKSLSPTGAQSGPLAFQGSRFLLDTVQNDLKLDLAVELLQRFQEVEVLSAPTVRVLNGHNAKIETGERTPIQTANFNASGIATVTTTFEKTGVTLTVKPTVVADDTIRLEVKPEVSSVTGFSDPATSGGFAVPYISTRNADTIVNVKNNEIFLVGGLFATTEIVTENKLPILGDIPILGALFSSSNKQNVQSEILFFLQPRIIAPDSPGSRNRLVLPPDERK